MPPGLCRPGRVDRLPPLSGSVNLTIPLTTLTGLSDAPGAAAGFGPLDPDTARTLACAAAGHQGTRWHITVTGPGGRAVGYGSTSGTGPPGHNNRTVAGPPGRDGPPDSIAPGHDHPPDSGTSGHDDLPSSGPPGHDHAPGSGTSLPNRPGKRWTVSVTAEPIAAGDCDHRNCEPRYRPGPALQRLIRDRRTTCSYYGCGRPAARCDLDHTIPYEQGGLTCECNLAAVCRHHHRTKQAEGWVLEQISPGVMAWLSPAGRRYLTLPSRHPT